MGRHEFTVIAWRDDFASLVEHVQKKLKAGKPSSSNSTKPTHLFALVLAEVETVEGAVTEPLEHIVKVFAKADPDTQARATARADHRESDDRRTPPAVPEPRPGRSIGSMPNGPPRASPAGTKSSRVR